MHLTDRQRFPLRSADELRAAIERLQLDIPMGEDAAVLGEPLVLGSRVVPNRLCVQPLEGHDAGPDGAPGRLTLRPGVQVADLKISDYLKEVAPSPRMDDQKALILAMQREKASFRLYSDLAETVEKAEFGDILMSLALEEAKHKLRLEIEYDDHYLTEN